MIKLVITNPSAPNLFYSTGTINIVANLGKIRKSILFGNILKLVGGVNALGLPIRDTWTVQ
jgi:hypothetical protein